MPRPTDPSQHNIELQSMRGIAATVVVLHHGLRTLSGTSWAFEASEVPLNAHAAVIIFFVLSGYVLAKSLMRRGIDVAGVSVFYTRRIFRIYPALWVGVVIGTLYWLLISPIAAPGLSSWMTNHYTQHAPHRTALAGSVVGLDNFLLPTSWTITVEICASVLLPAIVLLFVRFRWSVLPTIALLALVTSVSGPMLRNVPFYLVNFAMGAALACWPAMRHLRPGALSAVAAAAFLAFIQILPMAGAIYWSAALGMGLASAVLIQWLASRPVAWLRHRALIAVGDWSYSIYLIHLPIAFAVARLMVHSGLILADRDWAAVIVALATAAITIPTSAAIFNFVERPGIALGNKLIRQWSIGRDPAPSPADQPDHAGDALGRATAR